MSLQLLKTISAYFAASNSTATARIADCFEQGPVVLDEGITHRGNTDIQSLEVF